MSLKFQVFCIDCEQDEQFELNFKPFFNEYGNYIDSLEDKVFFLNVYVSNKKIFIL